MVGRVVALPDERGTRAASAIARGRTHVVEVLSDGARVLGGLDDDARDAGVGSECALL